MWHVVCRTLTICPPYFSPCGDASWPRYASTFLCCVEREPKALRRNRFLRAKGPIKLLYEEGCLRLPRGGSSTSRSAVRLCSMRWANTLSIRVYVASRWARYSAKRNQIRKLAWVNCSPGVTHHYMPCCDVDRVDEYQLGPFTPIYFHLFPCRTGKRLGF